MRNNIFAVLIICLASCSKEQIEPKQERLGVTSYALSYDDKWNLLDKKLSFHWHDMEPEILAQFPKANDTLCTLNGNMVLTYKLEVDNCKTVTN